MAGYDGFSKSNNAVAAENAGMLTASAVARRIGHGATAAGVKSVLERAAWHHTSKMYNCTDYFDYDSDLEEAAEDGRDLMTEIIAASKPVETVRYRADVEWLEFSPGRYGSRKHPYSDKFEVKNVEVEERGDWYIFHFADGTTKRKRMDSTGTYVYRISTW